MPLMSGQTLYDKIWDAHLVSTDANGEAILYIDLHLIHEVTTPQAFAGLRAAHRPVRRPDRTLAVADHNTPTEGQALGVGAVADEEARLQLQTLERNVTLHGIEFLPMGDPRNGIVHVVGPEQGRTQPGMTIVCGDSHTSTHGAFGALAQGIGTSEVEHVLATQTLRQFKSRNMRVTFTGTPAPGVGAKDYALALIGRIGTSGGTGYVIEYAGEAISALVDGGPHDPLQHDHRGRRPRRSGRARREDLRLCHGPSLRAQGRRLGARARQLARLWSAIPRRCSTPRSPSTSPPSRPPSPGEPAPRTSSRSPAWCPTPPVRRGARDPDPPHARLHGPRARPADRLGPYRPGVHRLVHQQPHRGPCAPPPPSPRGRKVADHVRAMIVPGSGLVKEQAEEEGLDVIFKDAGFDWREPGCSMCLGMNPDRLAPGERCASTSNRNFEGRQGRAGRTHLMSPPMAAAAAIAGHIADVRDYL